MGRDGWLVAERSRRGERQAPNFKTVAPWMDLRQLSPTAEESLCWSGSTSALSRQSFLPPESAKFSMAARPGLENENKAVDWSSGGTCCRDACGEATSGWVVGDRKSPADMAIRGI